jgi:hypothetical protein
MESDGAKAIVYILALIGAWTALNWLWSLSWIAIAVIAALAVGLYFLRQSGAEVVAKKEADEKARIIEGVERGDYDWQQPE